MLTESEVQFLVLDNHVVQDGICNALEIVGKTEFIREDPYINGITADFTLLEEGVIKAIIECKAGNINVTDYVRGIGQLFQYEYFCEEQVPHKSLGYDTNFSTVYFFPASVLSNNTFNVAKFKYPKTSVILEYNEVSNAVRRITQSELIELEKAENDNLITISPYFFRDNRMFEYYILLKYLLFKSQIGYDRIDRRQEESQFLIQLNTINNGNWRNAFITLSNLGLIDNNNIPTEAGKLLAISRYEQFAVKMFYSYIKPYYLELLECFCGESKIDATNSVFVKKIKEKYHGRDVLYLTQSQGRYISSWLNILRDDYGIIGFKSRNSFREFLYDPMELNDAAFENKIKKYSVAYDYINKYTELIKKGL